MAMTLTGSGTGTVGVPNSATAQNATSGTSIDFTGLPAGLKRITVLFNAVSLNGSSIPQIQLGSGGAVETTGYVSLVGSFGAGGTSGSTTGFLTSPIGNAGYVFTGIITIALVGSNVWVASVVTTTDASLGNFVSDGAGRKTLSSTLDRVRITALNGTDTFDNGSINIIYE